MRGNSGLALARALAHDHPNAMLPCPLCAAGVRGDNLARHLGKTHPGAEGDGPGGSQGYSWTGPSRRVPQLAFVVLGVAVPWVAVTQSELVAVHPDLVLSVPALLVVLFLTLLALGESNRLRARLVFADGTFVLHPALGLRRRRVSSPVKLELGAVREKQSRAIQAGGDIYFNSGGDRRIGSYLRLYDQAGSVTVLAAGPSVRTFWDVAGTRSGPVRRRYDIKLEPPDSVQLHYLLAAQRALSLRPG